METINEFKLRKYQEEALENISLHETKCLVKMFCGTGKSIIITKVIMREKKELSVVVFPSLALIEQYSRDYVDTYFKSPQYKTMNISSEILKTIDSTTDSKKIKKFLKSKTPKIVLVTYQSYAVLLDCLEGQKIGLVCYDEAHHVVGIECQKLVFGTSHFEKEVFFTATPKNENGIVMYDRENPEKNMCGPVAYEYTYLQGLNDEHLNAFEVCVDMYTENTNASVYEAMARAILKRGTGRVLTFHSGVNGESNTNVWNFVKPEEFQTAFDKVLESEFPEKKDYYQKITFKGMDGETPAAERKTMLADLDKTPDNEIYIISSCETIGEGVDTKRANMCVFADPKTSITKIMQNIGRVVRPNPSCPLSTILIPCWINMENYAEAKGDKEKQDELIRTQMRSANGDYAPILNVLGALPQEDPEMREMCLNHPNRRVIKEESLEEQGFRIVDDGDIFTPEEVEEMKADKETPLEIHNTDETIVRFNEESEEEMKRLYHDEEMNVYKPIVRRDSDDDEGSESDDKEGSESDDKEGSESDSESVSETDSVSDSDSVSEGKGDRQIIQPPNPKKRIQMAIHQNAEIQMLWGVKGDWDFSKKFCSVVIECEVSYGVEKWHLTHTQVKAYMDAEYKSPAQQDKNPEIRKLGSWVSNQKTNYAKKKQIMSKPDIRLEWETTLQKYNEYLCNSEETWHLMHTQLIEYMEKHKKRPNKHDKNRIIKKLGRWIGTQNANYAKNLQIMANPDIRKEWEATLEKYGEYLCIGDEQWRLTLTQLVEYMEKHKKSPSSKDKNPVIKTLGIWTIRQKRIYAQKMQIMSQQNIRLEWKATLEKYGDYLCIDGDETWHLMHAQLITYMDKENKPPSAKDKNPIIKTLGTWVSRQKTNYEKKQKRMSNPNIRNEWEATLEKYSEYLCDSVETWHLMHRQLIVYIEKHKKLPPQREKLGSWVSVQKKNYKKNINITSRPAIRKEWEATLQKYPEYLKQSVIPQMEELLAAAEPTPPPAEPPAEPTPTPKKIKIMRKKKQTAIPAATTTTQASTMPHHLPPPSAIGLLHKAYKRMDSDTLHQKFKADPQLHAEYHAVCGLNLSTYAPASIPSNRIIQELEKIQTKRQKVVVDMGCGKAPIAHHFLNKNDTRFAFHNYDHQSGGDPLIQEKNIRNLPLEDASAEIAIMSVALWGTTKDRNQYIKEAYRVLESGGKFYIIDITKKWSPEPLTPENGGELLRTMLTSNGFKIINEDIGLPFCLFVCVKIY